MLYKAGKCRLRTFLRPVNKNGMTQSELARRLGVNRRVVSRWVNDVDMMTFAYAVSVARILGIDPAELYEWIPEGGASE